MRFQDGGCAFLAATLTAPVAFLGSWVFVFREVLARQLRANLAAGRDRPGSKCTEMRPLTSFSEKVT